MNVISYAGLMEALRKASRLARRVNSGGPVNPRRLDAFCRIVEAAIEFDEPGEFRLLLKQDDGSWRLSQLGPWGDPISADGYGYISIGKGGYKVFVWWRVESWSGRSVLLRVRRWLSPAPPSSMLA